MDKGEPNMPEDTFIAVLPPHRLGEIQGWRVTPAYQGYRLGARLLRAEGTAPPRGRSEERRVGKECRL